MTEQRYRYASVGVTEEKDVPAVLLGKRNATFEIAGMEYERTAILKLPEKMNQTEFDTWKESGGIDLIDLFFHCIHQKSVRADPPENEQADLMTDGGSPSIPEEEIEHRCGEARKQLRIIEEKVGENWLSGCLVSAIGEVDEAEEMLKGEAPVKREGEPVADGSGMPKMALEHLKELDETDDKIGEWLSEKVGEPIGGMTDLYTSEHSIEDAMNEVELGEGFSVKEPEYIELLTLLDSGREAAANDPPTLGVRNRLLMQLILANPEAYARIRKEMEERAREAQEEAMREMNQHRERQRMTERAADLDGDGVDMPLDDAGGGDG
jgi:hypothetical protein